MPATTSLLGLVANFCSLQAGRDRSEIVVQVHQLRIVHHTRVLGHCMSSLCCMAFVTC
ncbi:hypothetical protein PR003_g4344 [Phytophthora rubi]|uniref:Uncharacterized protein n=1 Tax=Phytophthora rubi TaxID=129364 RepID=A0A6A4FX25_9STRA|nr:hypothetical protein PR002_g2584 [Phytophthora rubi]KAE9352522.1 hypothetical protein PR003_g4344 [Phytophthora rubi]